MLAVVGDGKGEREVLDFLTIDDCTLEATHGTLGIREVKGIDTDGSLKLTGTMAAKREAEGQHVDDTDSKFLSLNLSQTHRKNLKQFLG